MEEFTVTDMEILRVFNNNVVLAKDATGEKIITGRGIGFKARPGQPVDSSKVVRIFVPAEGRDPDHIATMLTEIPLAHMTLVTDAVTAAGLPESMTKNASLLVALADHIGFAIMRAANGQRADYPLLAEVSQLYSEEYAQAQAILSHINRALNDRRIAPLPRSEAVAITLHLVNAGFSTGDLSFTYTMTGVLQQLLTIIESDFGITLEPETVNVGRFITHLRYLFVRIAKHEQLKDHSSAIGQAIRDSAPEAFRCAQRISAVIELRLGSGLTEDEVSYLTLHIARIVQAAAVSPTASRVSRSVRDVDAKQAPAVGCTGTVPESENFTYSTRKDSTMITRTATIGSSVGLHARPASLFTQAAAEYDYDIVISLDDEEADAASILEVMTLGAKHGDEVTLSCEDDSAAAALDELAAMLERDLDAE
ncbi:HPr family phosphocarrier protein [Corynebacterium amycolatum]|nr:HPr family phosphocarrier protein [Corynebacterium amycolatum]KAA9228050.1 HPr family phosphocarrier protein [Corynebacterium amycolatum]MBC6793913.1 phosphocarrier, HPr family protein [Corynebacterium sp. LK26]OFL75391.1 phosphocarrier, HPr family protein [Corynebacterium sp. HMSC077C02]OFU61099.1 phosphocarrier, HPr family protein [Corynebacterium sp. HMSC14H10]